ncbi:MAG: hypothetical protein IJ809_07090 [Clostridia bacterium]|nr:hypothetical protein [Clostridia bacterium]
MWRIFYYDETGKYGDGAGTVYIKRDLDSSTMLDYSLCTTYYTNSENKSAVLADMKKFNPQWAAGDGRINENNENVASYLCYHGAWETYLDSSVASYAIGGPSTEMYIDAWNQFKGEKKLDYKWVASGTTIAYNTSGQKGAASVNGYAYAPAYGQTAISKFGITTPYHVLTTEANSIFMTSGWTWLLCSPACNHNNYICSVCRLLNR